MKKKITPQSSKAWEIEVKSNPVCDDWKQYFGEEELDKVFNHYKGGEQSIIREEEIESDKSDDSCPTSESDLSDLDDLSEADLKQNVYVNKKSPPKRVLKSPNQKRKKPGTSVPHKVRKSKGVKEPFSITRNNLLEPSSIKSQEGIDEHSGLPWSLTDVGKGQVSESEMTGRLRSQYDPDGESERFELTQGRERSEDVNSGSSMSPAHYPWGITSA